MKNNIIKYSIDINKDKVKVKENVVGKSKFKRDLFTGSNNDYDIAEAMRCAAYELLQRAFFVQHKNDFYCEMDINEQIELMMNEFN